MPEIEIAAAGHLGLRLLLNQAENPRHFVGVDVEDVALGIERRAAPLRAAVEAGEDDGAFSAGRNELSVAAEFLKCSRTAWCASGVRCVSMSAVSCWRANGCGNRRAEAACRRLLRPQRRTPDTSGSRCGNKRLAGLAVKQKYEAGLGGLRDGVDRLAVARDRDQGGRGGEVAVPDIVMNGSESARRARRFRRSAPAVSWRRGCRRCDWRHRNRTQRNRWARTPVRAWYRATCRTSYWLNRCISRRPSARCRSRTRRDGGWCGMIQRILPVCTS